VEGEVSRHRSSESKPCFFYDFMSPLKEKVTEGLQVEDQIRNVCYVIGLTHW